MTDREKDLSATAAHSEAALATLKELQEDNTNGVFHRDFMQTRLDMVELYESQLKSELERCKTEKEEIHRHSHEVGKERMERRRRLARHTLHLLRAESDAITDRTLLWKTITEQHLAHHVDSERKQAYVELLLGIDTLLQHAHTDQTALPVLMIEDNQWYGSGDFTLTFGVTSMESNGLTINGENLPSIFLSKPYATINKYGSKEAKPSLPIPQHHIVTFTDSNDTLQADVRHTRRINEDVQNSRKPSSAMVLIGSSVITSRLETLFSENGVAADEAWKTFELIYDYDPSLYTQVFDSPAIRQDISSRASGRLLTSLRSTEAAAAMQVGDLSHYANLVSSSVHKDELYTALEKIEPTTARPIRHIFDALLSDV